MTRNDENEGLADRLRREYPIDDAHKATRLNARCDECSLRMPCPTSVMVADIHAAVDRIEELEAQIRPLGHRVRDVSGCICGGRKDAEGEWIILNECEYHSLAAENPTDHSMPWNCPTFYDTCNCATVIDELGRKLMEANR